MANLNTQSFSSLVSNWATTVQGAASQLVNFTIGSVLRAIAEATAYVALWLQGLILQVGALTRAATSNGSDLDSWFAQFGFTRMPASTATMQETFGRYTPTNQVVIPPGTNVQSADGSVVFTVIVDTTNVNYYASLGGYLLPANTTSISVTVQCTVAGTVGNVQANAINSLSTALSGVDYVNNAAGAINGVAAESDSAARARFVTFVASLSAATLLAVQNAIATVQSGMFGIIQENTQYGGTTQNGYFTAIINNGSGSATSTQLANASNAINAVRPLGSTFGAFAPTQVTTTVSMTITTATGYVHATVAALAQAALVNYINSLQPTSSGATLPYTSLASIAYGIAGVTNVTAVQLNSGTADLTINYKQVFAATTSTVTVS